MKKTKTANKYSNSKEFSFHWLLNKHHPVEQLPESISWNTPEVEPAYLKAYKMPIKKKKNTPQ